MSIELRACAAPAGRVHKGVTTDPMRLSFALGPVRLFRGAFFSLSDPTIQARVHRGA